MIGLKMGERWLQLKVKNLKSFIPSLFYAITGVVMLITLALSSLKTLHLGVLGALSLIIALLIAIKGADNLILIAILSIPMFVFSAVNLYAYITLYLHYYQTTFIIMAALMAIYIVLLIVSLIYIRKGEGKESSKGELS